MKKIALLLCLFTGLHTVYAQKYHLFSDEIKKDFPSVVYDFLERYLYEIDSLQSHHVYVDQKLLDDKVIFLVGDASSVREIKSNAGFSLNKIDSKYYQVTWKDSLNKVVLDLAFPMQYELLLGKPKVEIEKEFKSTIQAFNDYHPQNIYSENMILQNDSCLTTNLTSNYYVESLNSATYYHAGDKKPTFSNKDKWHSAANLFHGCIEGIENYTLYVEQNLYGFKTVTYTVPLVQWLAYCQYMQLRTYFAIEEEREDGLKAILIAQSKDLGFNHMMSLIIPDNFVENRKAVIKATLNAYIPTQNVKNLYQQYVDKPKKRI